MKLGKSYLLVTSAALAAVLSFAAVAGPSGQADNSEGVKPVPGSVSFVKTSNGLFLWGNADASIPAVTYTAIAPSKNIQCTAEAGCVVLITVMAEVDSNSTANLWSLTPKIDGTDTNPGNSPYLGNSQTSEFDTRSYTGTLQVSKGTHSVKTMIFTNAASTLYNWSESVQMLQ